MNEKIRQLSKGLTGKRLIEVLEEVKRQIADIRTPLSVRAEIQNEVRLGIIEALDTFLIEKIKINSGEISPPDPNEFE